MTTVWIFFGAVGEIVAGAPDAALVPGMGATGGDGGQIDAAGALGITFAGAGGGGTALAGAGGVGKAGPPDAAPRAEFGTPA